jgi:hypothetical protein
VREILHLLLRFCLQLQNMIFTFHIYNAYEPIKYLTSCNLEFYILYILKNMSIIYFFINIFYHYKPRYNIYTLKSWKYGYNECSYLSCCLQIICYPSDFFLIIFWFCKLLGVIINKIDSKNTKAHERQTDKQIVTRSWGWQTKMSPCKPMKMQDFHANLHRISYTCTVVCWFHIFKISRYKYYT